jgi:hypothetical protein
LSCKWQVVRRVFPSEKYVSGSFKSILDMSKMTVLCLFSCHMSDKLLPHDTPTIASHLMVNIFLLGKNVWIYHCHKWQCITTSDECTKTVWLPGRVWTCALSYTCNGATVWTIHHNIIILKANTVLIITFQNELLIHTCNNAITGLPCNHCIKDLLQLCHLINTVTFCNLIIVLLHKIP